MSRTSASAMQIVWQVVTVAAVLALGIGLRVYNLQNESLWFDEAVSVSVLDEPTLGDFIEAERAQDPAMMPVYFVCEYYLAKATGNSIYALRLFSVAMAVGAMLVMYAFGRSLFGHWGGWIALLFLAIAKNQIWHSQDIRMYSMHYFLAIVSAYCFYLGVHKGKRLAWPVCLIANGLLIGTHLFGTTLLLVEGLYLLFRYGFRRRPVWIFSAAHVIWIVPLIAWLASISDTKVEAMIGWIPEPNLQVVFDSFLYVFTGGQLFGNEELKHLLYSGGLFVGLALWFLVIYLWWVLMGRPSGWKSEWIDGDSQQVTFNLVRTQWVRFAGPRGLTPAAIGFLTLWLFVPNFVLYFLSITVRPCYVERYVLHSSFALFLLAAAGVVAMKTPWMRFVSVALVCFASSYVLEDLKRPMRPNWHSVADYIAENRTEGDLVRVPEGYPNEYLLSLQCYQPDVPFVTARYDFTDRVITLASLGNTVWVPVIVQDPLSPKAFQRRLNEVNVPYTMEVILGRQQIAIFHLNEDRKYILENLDIVTGGASQSLADELPSSVPPSPVKKPAAKDASPTPRRPAAIRP